MRVKIISTAVAATLALVSLASSAEDMYRGSWYVVPGVSMIDTDDDLEAEHGRGAFIKFGKEISQNWDLQGGIGYNNASEDTGIPGVGGHYKQTTLGLDALYMFSREKFRPFLLVGLGAVRNNVDYNHQNLEVNAKKTSYMANVGIGAQYLFNDSFGLQADLRHQLSRARTTTNDGIADKDTQTIGNNILSIGAIFRFGAPAPMPVVAQEPERVAEAAPAPVAEPAPAPEPAPVPVVAAEPCKPTFETITLSAEKLFAFDNSKMQAGAKPILDEVVEKLKAHPEFKLVVVEGHTDRIGSAEYNKNLSGKRATDVKNYLVSQGVDASRLQVIAKGESEPVVACDGVKNRKALIECLQPNRRVVISDQKQHEIEGKQGCN
jgi:OOP family OmpA-OmpF porin